MFIAPAYKEDNMSGTSGTGGQLKVNLDMDKVHEVLKTQPRFTVTTTAAGKETTLVEAIRTMRPGVAEADNQVNVLC
jgi:hypothetical protein